MALVNSHGSATEYDLDENVEVAIQKVVLDKPFVCLALRSSRIKEATTGGARDTQIYSFDTIRLD